MSQPAISRAVTSLSGQAVWVSTPLSGSTHHVTGLDSHGWASPVSQEVIGGLSLRADSGRVLVRFVLVGGSAGYW